MNEQSNLLTCEELRASLETHLSELIQHRVRIHVSISPADGSTDSFLGAALTLGWWAVPVKEFPVMCSNGASTTSCVSIYGAYYPVIAPEPVPTMEAAPS